MYTYASTVDEATAATGEFRAGGTDIQERLHSRISVEPLIDIFGIDGLGEITYTDSGVSIGALATVDAIGVDARLQKDYPALTLPAQILATPQIRHMATMGGVLCQRTRCTYFRHPELGCPKKGNADSCPSREGDHHFGVCFDFGPCVYPHPSSIGCALLTYDAMVDITDRGSVSIADFFGTGADVRRDNILEPHEMVTGIRLPPAVPNEKSAYFRQMSRTWAEWPLVEVVVRLIFDGATISAAKIGIGGVANIPFRLTDVEEALTGNELSDTTLNRAAKVSTTRCNPLRDTHYKVPMIEASVLEALELAVADGSVLL